LVWGCGLKGGFVPAKPQQEIEAAVLKRLGELNRVQPDRELISRRNTQSRPSIAEWGEQVYKVFTEAIESHRTAGRRFYRLD